MANLKQAIQYAQSNPDDFKFHQDLTNVINSGAVDNEAQSLGIDLSPFKTLTTPEVVEEKKGFLGRVGEGFQDIGGRLTEELGDLGQEFATQTEQGDVLGATETLLRSGLRTTGAVAEAAFEPIVEAPVISNVLNFIGEKFAGTQAGEKLAELVQANPERAQDVFDILNVAALGGGKVIEAPVREVTAKVAEKTGEKLIVSGTKKLVSDKDTFIRELVRPVQTKAVKEAQVARTTEIGKGPLKRSIIEPTPQELKIESALKTVKDISVKNTDQQNFNVIKAANKSEAELLKKSLDENDFIFPKKELKAKLNEAKVTLGENPQLVGDNQKIAQKLIDKAEQFIDKAEAKGSSLLQVRKDFDQWVISQKGTKVFDPKTESAFTVSNNEIRKTINNFLDEKATNVAVKESLQKQSSLFGALENLKPKAAIEFDTAVGRAFQNAANAVGVKNKIVQQIGAAVGLAGFGAAATFAPAAAVTGILGFLAYKGGKLILKPELRIALGKLLKESAKVIKPADKAILEKALIDVEGLSITDALK